LNTTLLTVTLAGLAMIGPFSIDTFLPSFPAIAQQFGIGMAVVQQALSAFLFAFAGMSLFYGTLSDSFGRRPVVLSSLALFTVASLGAALAPGFGWLLLFRVLQGLAAGGGMVIGLAVVRDRFEGATAHRMVANITAVFGIAPAIAPVIGGQLHVHFGWRSVFVFMTAVGAFLWLACWRGLDESLPRTARVAFHPATLARNYASALMNGRFLARTVAFGFAFGGLGIYIASAASFVIGVLHLSETSFAWLFVPIVGGMVCGSSLGGRLTRRMGARAILRLGLCCMGVAAAGNVAYNALFQAQVPWAVLPIMLYTFGLGLAMPVMSLTTLELLPAMRGLASSLLNFVQMLVFSVLSGVVVPLLFDSAFKIAMGVMVCFVVACISWWIGTASAAISRGSDASAPAR
jgi:DHA1 family bicyclomycin/chloramphenicol resistance-like MFS transporter